ncbi:MAG: 2Fe-2S iron-sulfur cluster binding domain-containing protein [Myxococcales bacterium]|nr:2Fe-2S iron-sulfur cluster binding domain-containing protein [Myxococcales bacterium]
MDDLGSFTFDGQTIGFRSGESVLEAARRAGESIPSLCFDPRLKAYGSCRVCVVKINGRIGASCTTPCAPGLTVTVDDEIASLRRTLVELTGSLLPDDRLSGCPQCRLDGTCEFHRVARAVGAEPGRFAGAAGGVAHPDDNPFLGRDYSRCINCYRCVRICDEIEGDNAITARGRGFESTIAAWFDRGLEQSSCELCGQCIHTCPTGALTDRKMATKIAEVEKKTRLPILAEEIQRVESVCPYCGTGCGITLNAARGELLGITPVMDSPAADGALCVKGQYGTDFIASPDRLTKPLIRDRDPSTGLRAVGGGFREASWDEALTLVAGRLAGNLRDHGPDTFAAWASARTTSEANYLLMKFTRGVIGTNNIDNCQRT